MLQSKGFFCKESSSGSALRLLEEVGELALQLLEVFEKFFEVKLHANRLTIIRIMARWTPAALLTQRNLVLAEISSRDVSRSSSQQNELSACCLNERISSSLGND